MKLYSLPHSPYSARVRMQIYLKGLDIETVEPPGFRTEDWKAFNVLGKVPMLEDGDFCLPESGVILDYLEDVYPEPPLRPADPAQRAIMNVFARFADTYVQGPLFTLFKQLISREATDAEIAGMVEELGRSISALESLMQRYQRPVDGSLDLADCNLVPVFYFVEQVPPLFAHDSPIGQFQLVSAWWRYAGEQEAVARVLNELSKAMAAFLNRP